MMKIKTTKKTPATKTVVTKATKKAPACKCARKAKVEKKATVFTLHAEKGKAVYLAGDFNAWDPTAKKMTFKDGIYSVSVDLPAGDHQYKFVVDGTWCADPENVNSIPNDQGTFNSIVTVK